MKKLIPKQIKSKLFNTFVEQQKKNNRAESEHYPKQNLEDCHVQNTKLLKNRERLLELLPKHSVCAEIGVDEGAFSQKILDIVQPTKLVLVDVWGTERYNQEKRKGVENRLATQIENKQVEIKIGYSTDVYKEFEDGYFDWVYIDTDHSYETTKSELNLWSAKLKPGGIIAGHDFIVGNWNDMIRYGVVEAVYEFCIKEHWEIIYLSTEIDYPPSFALRKI